MAGPNSRAIRCPLCCDAESFAMRWKGLWAAHPCERCAKRLPLPVRFVAIGEPVLAELEERQAVAVAREAAEAAAKPKLFDETEVAS